MDIWNAVTNGNVEEAQRLMNIGVNRVEKFGKFGFRIEPAPQEGNVALVFGVIFIGLLAFLFIINSLMAEVVSSPSSRSKAKTRRSTQSKAKDSKSSHVPDPSTEVKVNHSTRSKSAVRRRRLPTSVADNHETS